MILPPADRGACNQSECEDDAHDDAPDGAEPRALRAIGKQPFGEQDGRGDAPDGVDVEHPQRPPRAHAECGDVAGVEQAHVQVKVVGIEEGLGGEGFFEDGVSAAEEQDGGPAAAGGAGDLADEQRAGAVHGRKHDERGKKRDGQIAQEVFGDQRGEEKENRVPARGWRRVASR